MVLNSYLKKISQQLIISVAENENIKKSLKILKEKIIYNLDDISEHFCFGSYMRNTYLPHALDKSSDIDYLIVFEQGSIENSDRILTNLAEFVIQNFSSESIIQSQPTCIVEMNGIYIELIPAYKNEKYFINYKIPTKDKEQTEWVATVPNDLNEYLVKINSDHNENIIPLLRVIKYWNVINHYLYSPYFLENYLTFLDYPESENLINYFYYACESLPIDDLEELDKQKVLDFKLEIAIIKNEKSMDHALAKLSSLIPYV